jgi:protein-disulfide isomerase
MARQSTYARLTLPIGNRDHIQGPISAPIAIVEYGDYQCPYCGEAYYIVKELQSKLGNDMCFAFRNFPLATVHPHAEEAAEAAEAAGAHRMFWEMHDTLYEHQHALAEEYLVEYAELLGLNPIQFRRELERHAHEARVREDFLTGARSGVNGTPTFFINGVRHDGSYDLASLLAAIQVAASG